MEVIHRKGISITLAVEPDIPQEKRIYDFRVTFQVSIEIENKTVVQRSLHTHFMKTFSKTMVVFNGVSVGLENIFVPVNLTGGIGSSLQGGGGRKHHLEIMFVIFKFFEQRTPECDIIIAFYISNDTSARLLRVEFMGSVEVRRSQVIS